MEPRSARARRGTAHEIPAREIGATSTGIRTERIIREAYTNPELNWAGWSGRGNLSGGRNFVRITVHKLRIPTPLRLVVEHEARIAPSENGSIVAAQEIPITGGRIPHKPIVLLAKAESIICHTLADQRQPHAYNT